MWLFKKNYSKIFKDFDECNIGHSSDYHTEYAGMFYHNKLHGYGCMTDHKNLTIAFGIFSNGRLSKNMGDIIADIQSLIGNDSKMISTLVFGEGVYIGEAMSPAGYHNNPILRRDRYGIMILKKGMFVGTFPAGHYLSRCMGAYYNLDGEEVVGTFDIGIEDHNRWGNDELGEYLPSY